MKNIIIISQPFRPARRIATEIEKLGHKAYVINPKNILGFNFDSSRFYVSTNTSSSPIEVRANNVSYVLAYCNNTITDHFNKVLKLKTANDNNSIKLASNKYLSSLSLSSNHIPVPKEILVGSKNHSTKWLFDIFDYPFIMKSLHGSQGRGVFLVEDKKSALSLHSLLIQERGKYIIQEFVNTAKAEELPHDFRLFVVNGEVVASMKRTATTGIKTNHSIHKNSEKIEPSDEMKRLAIRSMSTLGLKIGGVDMAYNINTNRWVVYEVNSCPGVGIEKVTDTNVSKSIAQYVLSQAHHSPDILPESLPKFKITEMATEGEKEENEFGQDEFKALSSRKHMYFLKSMVKVDQY